MLLSKLFIMVFAVRTIYENTKIKLGYNSEGKCGNSKTNEIAEMQIFIYQDRRKPLYMRGMTTHKERVYKRYIETKNRSI